MAKSESISAKSFTVKYPNGKAVEVLRLPIRKLEEANIIAQKIFERFFTFWEYSPNCLGDVLSDPEAIAYIHQLANILPVAGQTELGIDVDAILDAGDWEQIGQIFLTQSVDLETGEIKREESGPIKPSKFAQLNQLNFFKVRAIEMVRKEPKAEETTPSPPVETESQTS